MASVMRRARRTLGVAGVVAALIGALVVYTIARRRAAHESVADPTRRPAIANLAPGTRAAITVKRGATTQTVSVVAGASLLAPN